MGGCPLGHIPRPDVAAFLMRCGAYGYAFPARVVLDRPLADLFTCPTCETRAVTILGGMAVERGSAAHRETLAHDDIARALRQVDAWERRLD